MRGEIKVVRNMSKSMTSDQISEATGLELEYIQKILLYIRNNPEESDAGIAARILAGD